MTHESENMEDFAALFEASMSHSADPEAGTLVKGTIVGLSRESVFVDIAAKAEATIDLTEFMVDGKPEVTKGDTFECIVVSTSGGEIKLTTKPGLGAVSLPVLQTARNEGLPVFGRITGINQGGAEVLIGSFQAFCPMSQLGIPRGTEATSLIGTADRFSVEEIHNGGRKIIVSRRKLRDLDFQRNIDELKKTCVPGAVFEGAITRIEEYGVFVDIGGLDALVPRSELGRSRSVKSSDFSLGDKVKISILTADWESRKVSASLRNLEADPWADADLSLVEGQEIAAKIVNIIKNGAFAEIRPGLEGFIHVSRMSPVRKINRPEDAVAIGDNVQVRVESIDRKEHKLSLELITDEADPWKSANIAAGTTIEEAIVEKVMPVGLEVRLANGMSGFIPAGQLAIERRDDLMRAYKQGQTVRCIITETDTRRRSFKASERDAKRAEEAAEVSQYMSGSSASSNSSALGSQFGDLLSKMKKDLADK